MLERDSHPSPEHGVDHIDRLAPQPTPQHGSSALRVTHRNLRRYPAGLRGEPRHGTRDHGLRDRHELLEGKLRKLPVQAHEVDLDLDLVRKDRRGWRSRLHVASTCTRASALISAPRTARLKRKVRSPRPRILPRSQLMTQASQADNQEKRFAFRVAVVADQQKSPERMKPEPNGKMPHAKQLLPLLHVSYL